MENAWILCLKKMLSRMKKIFSANEKKTAKCFRVRRSLPIFASGLQSRGGRRRGERRVSECELAARGVINQQINKQLWGLK